MAEERLERVRTRYLVPEGITQLGPNVWVRFPPIPLSDGREGEVDDAAIDLDAHLELTLTGPDIRVRARFNLATGTYSDVEESVLP